MEMRMKQKRKILRHLAEELAVTGVVELRQFALVIGSPGFQM